MIILTAIREAREQRRKAREVLRHLEIPQAVSYLATDQMARPGKRRAARWAATKKIPGGANATGSMGKKPRCYYTASKGACQDGWI